MTRVFTLAVAALALPAVAHAQTPELSFAWTATYGGTVTDNDALDSGMDPFEIVFDQGSVASDALYNYAQSGSLSTELPDQFGRYRTDVIAAGGSQFGTFHGVITGTNDVLQHVGGLTSVAPGEDPALDAALDDVVDGLRQATTFLASRHPDGIVVIWTIGDLTYAPLFDTMAADQVDTMRQHLERLNDDLWALNGLPNVVVVDMYALMQDWEAHPPMLRGVTVTIGELFVDDMHPDALANALSANEIMRRLDVELGTELPQLTEDELADIAGIP